MGITYDIRKTYPEIRHCLESGDIVLFSGQGLISRAIEFITFSKMSHIGMIVKSQWGELFVLESDRGKDFIGVQMSPLGEKIRNYKGRVFIRKLCCVRHSVWHNVLNNAIRKCRKTTYVKGPQGVIELLSAALDFWPFNNKKNADNAEFCSDHIANIFQKWHFLPMEPPSNEYTPADFEEGAAVDKRMKGKNSLMASLMGTIEVISGI